MSLDLAGQVRKAGGASEAMVRRLLGAIVSYCFFFPTLAPTADFCKRHHQLLGRAGLRTAFLMSVRWLTPSVPQVSWGCSLEREGKPVSQILEQPVLWKMSA